jgi:hypothetical protein
MGSSGTGSSAGLYGYTGWDTNVIQVRFYASDSALHSLAGTTAITDTNWHHYAAVREGNTLKLYLDGKLEGTLDVTGLTVSNPTTKFSVGRMGEYTSTTTKGWIDEFRFSKGIARWTAEFTPPQASYYGNYIPQTPTPAPTAEWVEKKYAYSTAVPHAVTALTDAETTETLGMYEYDENGNMTAAWKMV